MMRELMKSMMSYTWASSLFGTQQMLNLLSMQWQNRAAAERFDKVTHATTEQMSDVARATFRAGDNIQRGMTDMMFGVLTLGAGGCGGRRGGNQAAANSNQGGDRGCGQQATGAGQQTTDLFRQGMNVVGQAAGLFGSAMGGAASSWSGRGDRQQREPTGWGPVPRESAQ
jgi:hypothetical protein